MNDRAAELTGQEMPPVERRSPDSWLIEILDRDYERRREEVGELERARGLVAQLAESGAAVSAQVLSKRNPRRCLLYYHHLTGFHDLDRRRPPRVDPADTPC